jgi:hypothetical protein
MRGELCICEGDRWPDGSLIVTVGCRVHHRMPDGCVAADHEVLCEGCSTFVCDHDCMWVEDPDGESLVCTQCREASDPSSSGPSSSNEPPRSAEPANNP